MSILIIFGIIIALAIAYNKGYEKGHSFHQASSEKEIDKMAIESFINEISLINVFLGLKNKRLIGQETFIQVLSRWLEKAKFWLESSIQYSGENSTKSNLKQTLDSFYQNSTLSKMEYKQSLRDLGLDDVNLNESIDISTISPEQRDISVQSTQATDNQFEDSSPISNSSQPPPSPPPQLKKLDPMLVVFNSLQKFLESGKTNWLTFLGIALVIFSSLPVVQQLRSATTIYVVLIAYSMAIGGAGYLVARFFPWTGQMFYWVTLTIIPFDFAAMITLDFSNSADIILTLLSWVLLTAMAYGILRSLYTKISFIQVLVFVFLGGSAAFIHSLEFSLNSRVAFEFCLIMIPFSVLLIAYGLFVQQLSLGNQESLEQFITPFLLAGIFFGAFILTPLINIVSIPFWGIALSLIAVSILGMAWRLRWLFQEKYQDEWPELYFKFQRRVEYIGYVCSVLSLLLAFEDSLALRFVALLLAVVLAGFSFFHHHSWRQYPLFGFSAFCAGTFTYFQLTTMYVEKDIQSTCFSLLALGLMLLSYIKFKRNNFGDWWRTLFTYLSIGLTVGTWLLISHFDDWSEWTLLALYIVSTVYFLFAIYQRRNVFSYLALSVLVLSYFSMIVMFNPLLEFSSYRYYAIGFSFVLLGVGFLVQRFSPKFSSEELSNFKPSSPPIEHWKDWLTTDFIQPFKFQKRYRSLWPYLFSEPLYNLALLMTTLSILFDIGDSDIALLAMMFYASIFMVYPSRIWVYFLIMAGSDGILTLIMDVLPVKYHNWGLVSLSMGWFFMGILIEELLEARDRKKPDHMYERYKKFAQPFFHGAIAINLILLRYYFGDLQQLFSPDGWLKISEEALPLCMISIFYVLKMRVYISKLWLYPGLISGTLGLYFLFDSNLPVSFSLLSLTIIAYLWIALGYLFNHHKAFQTYVWEMIRHKVGKPDKASKFYEVHLADFASPFYTFSFLIIGVVLTISIALIPGQTTLFTQNFEFGIRKANPEIMYWVQLLNFVLIALFYWIHYPQRVPVMDGKYEYREKPLWLHYLPLIAVSAGYFWALSKELIWLNLPLYSTFLVLILAIVLVGWTFKTKQWGNYPLLHPLLNTIQAFFIVTFALSYIVPEGAFLIYFGLALSALLVLYSAQDYLYLYTLVISSVVGVFTLFVGELKIYHPFIFAYCFLLSFLVLARIAFYKETNSLKHYRYIFYVFSGLSLFFLFYESLLYQGQYSIYFKMSWGGLALTFALATVMIRESFISYLSVASSLILLFLISITSTLFAVTCVGCGILLFFKSEKIKVFKEPLCYFYESLQLAGFCLPMMTGGLLVYHSLQVVSPLNYLGLLAVFSVLFIFYMHLEKPIFNWKAQAQLVVYSLTTISLIFVGWLLSLWFNGHQFYYQGQTWAYAPLLASLIVCSSLFILYTYHLQSQIFGYFSLAMIALILSTANWYFPGLSLLLYALVAFVYWNKNIFKINLKLECFYQPVLLTCWSFPLLILFQDFYQYQVGWIILELSVITSTSYYIWLNLSYKRAELWWLIAALAQIVWFFPGIKFEITSYNWSVFGHLYLWFIAVTLLTLGYFNLVKTKNDRNLLIYLGLGLILAVPVGSIINSQGFSSRLLYWSELLILTILCLSSSSFFKLRAIFYTGFFSTLATLAMGALYLWTLDQWVYRWGLFIFVGSLFIGGSLILQVKQRQIADRLKGFTQVFEGWH